MESTSLQGWETKGRVEEGRKWGEGSLLGMGKSRGGGGESKAVE